MRLLALLSELVDVLVSLQSRIFPNLLPKPLSSWSERRRRGLQGLLRIPEAD
jgi:hypothetical protein